MRRAAVVGLGFLLAAFPAPADEIWLANGNRLEGKLRRLGSGQVEVTLSSGRVVLPERAVLRVATGATPAEEVESRLARLAPADAVGRWGVARWCRERGDFTLEQSLARQVVEIAPDHAEARATLGYFRHEGRWLVEREYRAARGEVSFRGRWMAAAERDRILAEEAARAAAERARLEAARAAWLEAEVARLAWEVESLRRTRYTYLRTVYPAFVDPGLPAAGPPAIAAPAPLRVQTPRPVPPIVLPVPEAIPPLPLVR